MANLSKRERSVASKYRKYERCGEQAKKFYDRRDRLLAELAIALKPKMRCRITNDGKCLTLIDKGTGDDVIIGWGHAAVRRWELKVITE